MICSVAAASTILAAAPTAASASTSTSAKPASAAEAQGCVGASRKMEPNGADAICVQGAGYITVHITCVTATTGGYYDRSGPRAWSNARDPLIGGSRVYCDLPGDPLLSHSFTVG
ncbi:hypothetical protein [Pseudonocardia sp. TRM90224]|uniref:hypothetical protein n=1 Tax=Pseudonocardia sp. TRM90224 TaxID=2812678 RepID=UPI001E38FFF8|nr:hypothetical protein [Pseudonocardia sp. TRM90224]